MSLLSPSFPLSHIPQDSQPKEVHFGATQDGLSLPILINYKDNPPNRRTQDNLIVVIPQLEHSFHVVIDCVNLAVLSNHHSPMQWLSHKEHLSSSQIGFNEACVRYIDFSSSKG